MSKSPSLRRIQADVRELALDPSDRYHAAPLENDMFEWHFTIRGAEATDFEGGIYHGRILLPPEYPFKPPHILFLTPSGRFETNTKVCLSFSAFHPELWQPAWGIRLILEALISFLPTPADGAIGALDWSKEERQRLAKLSRSYCCPTCGKCSELLPELKEEHTNGAKKKPSTTRFAKEIAELQRLQLAADRKKKSPAEDMATESQDETKTEPPKAGKETTDGAPEIAAATSAESINQEAPEEEIVFDTPSPMASPATISTQLAEERAEEEKGQSAAATPATENTMPDMGEQVQAQINNNNAMPILEDDPSWMYDPLLNLMMVLLAVICYLLIQKYQVLMEELYELQHMSDF